MSVIVKLNLTFLNNLSAKHVYISRLWFPEHTPPGSEIVFLKHKFNIIITELNLLKCVGFFNLKLYLTNSGMIRLLHSSSGNTFFASHTLFWIT